jgi:hypothetical protein
MVSLQMMIGKHKIIKSPRPNTDVQLSTTNYLRWLVKNNSNKVNKTFIKIWLAARKANIKDAIQARKRKHPQPEV